MTETARFKALMKRLGYSMKDIAEVTGNQHDSMRSLLKDKMPLPRWGNLIIHLFEGSTNDQKLRMIKELIDNWEKE